MTGRTRLTVGVALAALLPLAGLVTWLSASLRDRLDAERGGRAMAAAGEAGASVRARHADVAARVQAAAAAVADGATAPADLAATARLARLDALEVFDADGRVLASAHFPEDRGRQAPGLWAVLTPIEAPLVLRTRTAGDALLALAARTVVRRGADSLLVLGGVRLDPGALPGTSPRARVSLELPGTAAPGGALVRLGFPFLDALRPAATRDTAYLSVVPDVADVAALHDDLRRSVLLGGLAAALLATLAAAMLAPRLRRPVAALVARAEALDLERAPAAMAGTANGELAGVAAALDGLEARLAASAARLRDAERRAALGDAARQVTHDLRNGLAPMRQVLRHLDQVAADAPGRLATTWAERAPTLHGAVDYLDALARDWGRQAAPEAASADPVAIARAVGAEAGTPRVRVQTAPAPPVAMTPLALHRVLTNLVANAIQSLPDEAGEVRVEVSREGTGARLVVADTGRGMARSDLERALAGGWTSRADGSGLGLGVVRRLVEEAGGRLTVDTTPGAGTTVVLHLPAAGAGEAT